MKRRISLLLVLLIALLAVFSLAGPAGASRSAEPLVPPPGTWPVVGYQGQVTVAGTPFNGTGYFKFAILDYFGEGFYWSNAPMSGDQPDAAVSLTVSNGLFNVLLGDTTITNMAALSATPFRDSVCVLRVWFSSDGSTFTLLSPDRRIAAVPNALGAELANDANTLDGSHATAFASSTHTHQTLTAGTGLSGGTYNGGTPVTLNVGSGNGITANADNLDLGPLAANWNQTGPFDVVLGNAASELQIMESTGNTYYGILDVGDLSAHQTYNFTTGGTVWTAGNDGAGSGLDADLLDNQHASAFVGAGQANSVTSAMIVNGTVALADIGQNGCANGQVMQWNGTGWACANMAGVTDHGALTGLLDDDHPQYLNLAQNETVTGIPAFNGGIWARARRSV